MIIDRLGRLFENRRKKDEPVEIDRRKEDNKIKIGEKKVNKTKK